MLSAESHLGLVNSIVCKAERLCELWCLALIRKDSALCLLYKIYHRVAHSMNGYVQQFVAAGYARASAAFGELALVISRCRADKFSRSFLRAAVVCGTYCSRVWLVMAHWVLLKALWTCVYWGLSLNLLYLYFCVFLLFYSLLGILYLVSFWFIGCPIFQFYVTGNFNYNNNYRVVNSYDLKC